MSTDQPFAHSVAVVVGIDAYGSGVPPLVTAANDARRVASTLAEQHGYEVIQLIDGDATRERVTKLLTTDLPQRIGPDDRVLFYFAGHGVALDSDSGPNGYLLPADATRDDSGTYLYMPFVHDSLIALTCRHMLVVLDACFSGAFRWSGTRAVVSVPDVISQEKYERFVQDPAWWVLTSTAQDETALDRLSIGEIGSRPGDGEHSPFALTFLQAVDGAADVVGNDGLVTANELYCYLDDVLQEATIEAGHRQTPDFFPLRKNGKGQYVFFVPGKQLELPPAPPLTYENNPWRGLSSYEREDAPLFFGRDAAIDSLTSFVVEQPLTVLLGASGTGKSSLVKAGVIPRLEQDQSWRILPVVRPGATPLVAIADAVTLLAPDATRPEGPAHVESALHSWLTKNTDKKLLLVIDQTEELVTMARSPEDRDATLALLSRLLESNGDRLRIVLTLRTDFEPQLDRSALGDRWKPARYIVKPMSRADLQAVIEEPAGKRVLYFDPPDLVETLLDEVTSMPGALPLLSFALSEMYVRYINRKSNDRALTRDDYDQLGGVVGALRSRADEEYNALDDAQRATMERMLLRMVGGGGGNLARRRVSSAELVYPDADENARVQRVRQQLVAARLLVEGKDVDGDSYVEPAHDALVRSWGRLLQWIEQAGNDAVPLVTRQKLSIESHEWRRSTNKASRDGLLWKDPVRSAMLTPVVRARAAWLNEAELAFAQESVSGRRRARRIAWGVVGLVGALAVASTVLGIKSQRDATRAEANADTARVKTQLAETKRIDAESALAKANREGIRANDASAEAVRQQGNAETQRGIAVVNAERAEAEKMHAILSLFSSLQLSFANNAVPGSVCVHAECGAPKADDANAWLILSHLPEDLRPLGPTGQVATQLETHDFIAAREFGQGHVVAYAHDGLSADNLIAASSDNLTFIDNAIRWLIPLKRREGCPDSTKIVLWAGYVNPGDHKKAVTVFSRRQDWSLVMTNGDGLEATLACASVLWFGNPWQVPRDFAAKHVPLIADYVRRGGGLLVAGLGWSYNAFAPKPRDPYPGDVLGASFGLRFTLSSFPSASNRLIQLKLGDDTNHHP